MLFIRVLALWAAACGLLSAQSRNLDIYWIDVEGGAATLIVSPSGQALLADTGHPGPEDRDARRIHEVATKQAGLKKIDFLLTTHFHGDHVGGAAALSKMIPIERYLDHGDSIETSNPRASQLWETYKSISSGKRTVLKPGDRIPLEGVQVQVVASNGEVLAKPINGGGPNAQLCRDAAQPRADTTENSRSAGFLLTHGRFKFLDTGDLTQDKEMLLACPDNKLGKVTIMQATHHGFFNDQSGAPPHVFAVQPQVMLVNNGPRKGLHPAAYELISKIPGIEGIWQGHLALAGDKQHNTSEDMIANLEPTAECKGNWLKASVGRDGKFTLTNGRNGFSKTYSAR
jgi:beta-lactamase superfamily II metal-dependent hydrolase